MIRFGNFASGRIVFFDRFKLTSQIRLENVLHMDCDLLKLVTNLGTVGPDATVNQQFIKVRKMHHGRKTLAQSHWVDQR